jgi:hypothetical protein
LFNKKSLNHGATKHYLLVNDLKLFIIDGPEYKKDNILINISKKFGLPERNPRAAVAPKHVNIYNLIGG